MYPMISMCVCCCLLISLCGFQVEEDGLEVGVEEAGRKKLDHVLVCRENKVSHHLIWKMLEVDILPGLFARQQLSLLSLQTPLLAPFVGTFLAFLVCFCCLHLSQSAQSNPRAPSEPPVQNRTLRRKQHTRSDMLGCCFEVFQVCNSITKPSM